MRRLVRSGFLRKLAKPCAKSCGVPGVRVSNANGISDLLCVVFVLIRIFSAFRFVLTPNETTKEKTQYHPERHLYEKGKPTEWIRINQILECFRKHGRKKAKTESAVTDYETELSHFSQAFPALVLFFIQFCFSITFPGRRTPDSFAPSGANFY
jgi:hypothetical protein